jgi:SAM-dependent methyltransferase
MVDFSTIAARYAAYRPLYPERLADVLAELSPRRELAWDVGCGNGQLSLPLAGRFERVIATDVAQQQLDAAPTNPRIEYRVATAEASGLVDASVDLAVAAQAAHWFDWPRFCAEAERVTRPGAVVALVSYGNCEIAGATGREIDHYHHDVVGAYWPPGRAHVENGYHDLVLPWPAVAAPTLEMTAEWTRDELAGYVSSWSATARYIERNGTAAYDALCARLATTWPGDERRTIRWPLLIKLARR